MKYKYLIYIIVAFSILNCQNRPTSDNKLIGMAITDIMIKFGSPQNDTVFILTKQSSYYEYQGNLSRLYAKRFQNGDTIKIREMCWKNYIGEKVVWFEYKNGDWMVVDNLKWLKNINF